MKAKGSAAIIMSMITSTVLVNAKLSLVRGPMVAILKGMASAIDAASEIAGMLTRSGTRSEDQPRTRRLPRRRKAECAASARSATHQVVARKTARNVPLVVKKVVQTLDLSTSTVLMLKKSMMQRES